MSQTSTRSVAEHIELLFDGGSATGLSDRQLLERFTARRDSAAETAFATLVARHGPTVMSVCLQLVGDAHHAEDAFQAVFLVLACKAKMIRNPDLLGNWLYGVAVRTTQRARARLMRQYKKEAGCVAGHSGTGSHTAIEPTALPLQQSILVDDELAALHDEIARLPRAFQLPVVLFYFEGMTLDDAAQRLRWRPGTLRSRLARARTKLRGALSRRGTALSATTLTATLAARFASARVSATLCESTTRAAIEFAAGRTGDYAVATAAALALEMLQSTFIRKVTLLAIASALLGAATAAYAMHSSPPNQNRNEPVAQTQQPAAAKPQTNQQPLPGRMFIVGRVLDPQGKPVANASVMAYARIPAAGTASGRRTLSPVSIGQAQSNGSGSFRVDASRTSSSRNYSFGAVAFAPGFGAGWAALDPDADQPSADISLRPEQVIQVRLFDLQGRPAQGVTVSVYAIRKVLERGPDPARERLEGPAFVYSETKDFPAWPKPATTDAEGRFALHGIGRDVRVSMTVHDPRFAQQDISIETDAPGDTKQLTMALQPARIITGRVTYADTGKPVPHADITVHAVATYPAFRTTFFQTGVDGRFRANPSPADEFGVIARAPKGQPYMTATRRFDWPKGAVEHTIDLALARGMLIRGKVSEQGSGKPVEGALLTYNAPAAKPATDSINLGGQAETSSDGSFQLVAVPRSGYLAVRGPGEDYVLQPLGDRLLFEGLPGGRRFYSNAFVHCESRPDPQDVDIHIELRRGATVSGHLIAPDGRPARDTWMISRIMLRQPRPARAVWWREDHAIARNGRFEIHGLDPGSDIPVIFLDPQHKLGATVNFSGKMATSSPLTLRLERCGAARARLVNPNGKPLARIPAGWVILLVTPGQFPVPRPPQKDNPLEPDQAFLSDVDPINHPRTFATDPEGRVTFPALIPGATYRVIDRLPLRNPETKLVRDFTVKSGETLDLGDIVIAKHPPALPN